MVMRLSCDSFSDLSFHEIQARAWFGSINLEVLYNMQKYHCLN
jgi:hypothetical protein